MMTFRKLAANSDGKLIRAYLTEHTPEPEPGADLASGARPDAGGRLTAYYTGRDSRAAWRTDMAPEAADALGIDPTRAPTDAELDRLFEARRADTGEKWPTTRPREISAYGVVQTPAFLGYTRRAETAGLRGVGFRWKGVLCGRRPASPVQARWG